MTYRFTLRHVVPAAPRDVYDAWLSSRGHSAMTGSKARVSAKVGGGYTAWGDYISGKTLALVPGKKIVQSWRTTEFTKDDPDSEITVTLLPLKAGTRVVLVQEGVPDGQTSYQKGGWRDHYFRPMTRYFATLAARAVTKTVRKKKKSAKRKTKKKQKR